MAYQFIHVEGYGRAAGKGKSGGHTVASILAEAERREGDCPHVQEPKPPVVLDGLDPAGVAALATKLADKAKDARGHKLRKDALCLLGGVVSVPAGFDRWDEYKRDVVAWLNTRYGSSLVSVIEHTDEAHPHLHFYAVPLPGRRFDTLHPGLAAAAAADPRRGDRKRSPEEKEAGRKAGRVAYAQAMREFQDSFFQGVGRKYTLARLGPKKRRLTRAEWRAEEAARAADARLKEDLKAKESKAQAVQDAARKEREKLAVERERLELIRRELPDLYMQLEGLSSESLTKFKAETGKLLEALRTHEEGHRATQRRPDGKSHGNSR